MEEQKTLKYVGTQRTCYLGIVEEQEGTTIIKDAMQATTDYAANKVALRYVQAEIAGELKDVNVRDTALESVTSADEETTYVNTLRGLVERAERKVRAKAVFGELQNIVSKIGI